MLPSTDLKASAPRIIVFSVLNSPAHPYRYRRFACPLAGADARLAEKRGSVTPSFRGTFTPYLLPVRLAHQIQDAPHLVAVARRQVDPGQRRLHPAIFDTTVVDSQHDSQAPGVPGACRQILSSRESCRR